MKHCKSLTKTGAYCRARATNGDYCEWHAPDRADPRAIGVTPGRVTEIAVTSTELPPGQVRRKKPTQRRPRRWLWTRNTKIHTENLDWSQDATKE